MTGRYARALSLGLLLMPALLAAPSSAAPQATKLRIGSSLSPPALDAILPHVALEGGFFRKQGLDVQVLEFRGGATNMKALLAGDVAVTQIGATDVMVAASRGAKVRLVFVSAPVQPFHFVARKEVATTLQGLVGKTIAVSGIGALSYHIPRMVLQGAGVDPDGVKYTALGSPADRFKALLAGKVDATMVLSAEAAKLQRYPEIVSLVQVSKALPEVPYEFVIAKEDFIEKNPDTMLGLTRALAEANRWIAANKAGTVAIAARVMKEEAPETIASAYDLIDPRFWGANGEISDAAYRFTADFLAKVGYLKDPVPLERLFDRRFLDRALRDLGRR